MIRESVNKLRFWKMKTAVSIFVLISCTIIVSGQFSKRLENLDVDSILKNDRILTNYIKCVLDQGQIDFWKSI